MVNDLRYVGFESQYVSWEDRGGVNQHFNAAFNGSAGKVPIKSFDDGSALL